MLSLKQLFLFNAIFIVLYGSEVITQDINQTNITIPISQTITYANKQLYKGFIQLNTSSTLQVNLIAGKSNISFIIFQVHSHLYNVTLYKDVYKAENMVTGTNIGLHSSTTKLSTFYIVNNNNFDLNVLVMIQGYYATDPIPGGCNMEMRVPIAPYMISQYNDDYIMVNAAPAQVDANCLDLENIRAKFYIVYLPEQNFDSDVYFDTIMNMTTFDNIERVGQLIPYSIWRYRRMISAYPGTGAVYVALAHNIKEADSYSVYVPNVSYGCDPLNNVDCDFLKDALSEFMCATLFFIGLFICFFGHRFFKIQTFLIGFLSGLVITYILISLLITMDRSALVYASAISGLFIGGIRTVCWWLYGIPVFSIILTSADIGFFTSSLVYYMLPGTITYLSVDLTFWLCFLLLMLSITIALLLMSWIASLLCCATIGAFATIYSLDIYLGSNLKYILINIVRRATVKNFRNAALVPAFQVKDAMLTSLWLLLLLSGFIYQYFENKGRPPFPPPPRSVRAVPERPATPISSRPDGYRRFLSRQFSTSLGVNERTPLIKRASMTH